LGARAKLPLRAVFAALLFWALSILLSLFEKRLGLMARFSRMELSCLLNQQLAVLSLFVAKVDPCVQLCVVVIVVLPELLTRAVRVLGEHADLIGTARTHERGSAVLHNRGRLQPEAITKLGWASAARTSSLVGWLLFGIPARDGRRGRRDVAVAVDDEEIAMSYFRGSSIAADENVHPVVIAPERSDLNQLEGGRPPKIMQHVFADDGLSSLTFLLLLVFFRGHRFFHAVPGDAGPAPYNSEHTLVPIQ
jgi:hypothetical protein